MGLVPYPDNKAISIPYDWKQAGNALAIPGTTTSGYTGPVVIVLTPDALVIASPQRIEVIIDLERIEGVSIIKMDGILIERQTSVGPMLSPLPYPHGIEIVYKGEPRLRMRLQIATMFSNRTYEWAATIQQAAYELQMGDMASYTIIRRS